MSHTYRATSSRNKLTGYAAKAAKRQVSHQRKKAKALKQLRRTHSS